jgi:hypothetical protein
MDAATLTRWLKVKDRLPPVAAAPPAAPAVAARFPRMAAPACSKRGASLGVVDCDVCGLSGKRVEVLGCALHGRCTTDPLKRARGVRRCQGCPDAAA